MFVNHVFRSLAAGLFVLYWGRMTAAEVWPTLPVQSSAVEIPAQSWPHNPGPRRVRIRVVYPGNTLRHVNARTGVMLTLHNWGGEDCDGTANPDALANRLACATAVGTLSHSSGMPLKSRSRLVANVMSVASPTPLPLQSRSPIRR